MRNIEHGEIKSDVVLSGNDELILHGIIVGNVLAKDMSSFFLRGTVIGNLVIEDDAQVFLRGNVFGNVVSKGGKLIHFGRINGTIDELGGEIILKNSVVSYSNIQLDPKEIHSLQ